MTNCLFFGDSITYGEYDGILGGWVDYLKRFCHSKYYNENAEEVNIFNLGIGGETTDGLLKRIQLETEMRKSPDENLVFLFYGANDLAIKENKTVVSIPNFEANLQKAIEIAKETTEKIFLISILPISEKVDNVLLSSGKIRTNKSVVLYNQSIKKMAKKNKVTYVDIHTVFLNNKEKFISKDGIHPNEKGYEFIAQNIQPILKKYL